jgi:hypothetical protein
VHGGLVETAIDATGPSGHGGLDRAPSGRYEAALSKTAWGRRARRRFALMDGAAVLASAEIRDYTGTQDGRPVSICCIGDLLTSPVRRSPAPPGHWSSSFPTDAAAQTGSARVPVGLDLDAHQSRLDRVRLTESIRSRDSGLQPATAPG